MRAPKRKASRPVRAISSTGWHAWKRSPRSEILLHDAVGSDELVDEALVLLAVERSVQVVARPLILIARLREEHVAIDRRGIHDGRGRVEERERGAPHPLPYVLGESRGAEGGPPR